VRYCEGVAAGMRDRHESVESVNPPFIAPDACVTRWTAGYEAGWNGADTDGLTAACPPTDDVNELGFREGFLRGEHYGYERGLRLGAIDRAAGSNASLRNGGVAVLVVATLSALLGIASAVVMATDGECALDEHPPYRIPGLIGR
jgi:hypothetical protein